MEKEVGIEKKKDGSSKLLGKDEDEERGIRIEREKE